MAKFIKIAFFAGLIECATAGVWDDPKNLQALPKDISPGDLRATMMHFIQSTGSRCSTCHVAEDPTDISTYDHSSDDKEKKRKARAMIEMVNSINAALAERLSEFTAEPIVVKCATCHRGRAKPEFIEDIVLAAYLNNGMEAARERYLALRGEYFGSYSFDFAASPLNRLADQLAWERDFDGALGMLSLNLEFNPQSTRAYQIQGDVYKENGNIPAARQSYETALSIDPTNRFTQRLLNELESP